MSAAMKTDDGTTAPVIDITSFTVPNQRSLATMAHVGTDAIRHMIDMNRQFLDFVRGRLEEDAKIADHLATCASPNDALEAVNGFYKTAFDQYAEEVRVLSDTAARSMTETMQAAENGLKRSVEAAIPKK